MAELLLAIGILAVGLLSLVVVQTYATRARGVNNSNLLATQLAESELAKVENLAIKNFTAVVPQPEVPIQQDMFLEIEVVDNWQGSPNLKGVTVLVRYFSGHRAKGGLVKVWTLVRRPEGG